MAKVKFYSGSASQLENKPIENGAIYVTETSANKADMSVDIGGKRYNIKPEQTWNDITGKPGNFTPAAHKHVIADVTDLKDATSTAHGLMTAQDKKKLDLLTITQLPNEDGEAVFSLAIG